MFLTLSERKKFNLYCYLIESIIGRRLDLTMGELVAASISVYRKSSDEGSCFFNPKDFIKAPEILV
jgi:hypothetical protein